MRAKRNVSIDVIKKKRKKNTKCSLNTRKESSVKSVEDSERLQLIRKKKQLFP